ncbi:MAG: cobyrinate a,c-diamide synthase [Lachnospiraceae bacterium]|nr:cobyrinate a,c-diamide synthase [Lachnospiraceae bacterium]
MKINRIMIAAPKSGSGKTTITCALLQALKDEGENVVSYKCGPDYIDPMFHRKVLGIPSKNLDTFFTDNDDTRRLFLRNRTEDDFAVLEGVMGLFDGLGGIREEGSSYQLAKVTQTPIILVVDTKGMARSVIPLIAGFLANDKNKLIKGVILNRMSKSYYELIKPLIEQELSIEVVGYFPEIKQFQIGSRHLGLVMPDELEDIKEQLHNISGELRKTVSVEKVLQIAKNAKQLDCCEEVLYNEKKTCEETDAPVIAVARDAAFNFYYEDNLQMLKDYGAKLEFFSPLYDKKLPNKCCGILLGGGYPELYAETLSGNINMLAAIKEAVENKVPVVAECGGFMYLHSSIEDKEGKCYAMAGVLSGKCFYTGKLVRFGYVEIWEKDESWIGNMSIKGHEFHYFDSEQNGTDCVAVKPVSGRSYDCNITNENCWIGFSHLYYPSNPEFAKRFVDKARTYKKRKGW